MPVLKSVIFNFLGISNLIESISKEVYITYTVGQEDFTVHRRKYHHDFRIPIESMKRSKHCCAIEIQKAKIYCISDGKSINTYKQDEFKIQMQNYHLFEDQNHQEGSIDENQTKKILNMKVSPKQMILVALVGCKKENDEVSVKQLCIFDLLYDNKSEFQEMKARKCRMLPKQLSKISIQFEFFKSKENEDKIFFIDESNIYLYDFKQDILQEIFDFPKNYDFLLQRQPELFVLNSDQTSAFVKAENDILILGLNS